MPRDEATRPEPKPRKLMITIWVDEELIRRAEDIAWNEHTSRSRILSRALRLGLPLVTGEQSEEQEERTS